MSKPPREARPLPGKVPPAYLPAPWNDQIVAAVKALAAGNANDGQQKAALDWIIRAVAGTYDQPFRPGDDGPYQTAFACGRQFVGQQIVKLVNLKTGRL